MKYETKERILKSDEKQKILKKLLSYDRNALKEIYSCYKIPYKNLMIYETSNGFNKEYIKKELDGYFYFTFDNDILYYNGARVYIRNNELKNNEYLVTPIWHGFGAECKKDIENLRRRKELKFYCFSGAKTQPKENKIFIEQVDRIKDYKINYKRLYSNVFTNNYYQVEFKNTRNNKSFVVPIEKEKEKNINNIIDKSGYIKINIIERRKQKAEKLKKEKEKNSFNNLNKDEILLQINKHYENIFNEIKSNINLKDINFIPELYNGFTYGFNIKSFVCLYDKIIKLNYKNILDFENDCKKFLSVTYDYIIETTKKDIISGKIWVNNTDLKLEMKEIYKNLYIDEDCFLYDGKKFDKKTYKVILS